MSSALPSTIQQLDANHEILKILIENSFDSILITDATLEGKIIYANDAFTKLTGYEIDEVIGKTPRILQGKATEKKVIDRLTGSLKKVEVLKVKPLITEKMDRLLLCIGASFLSKKDKRFSLGLPFKTVCNLRH